MSDLSRCHHLTQRGQVSAMPTYRPSDSSAYGFVSATPESDPAHEELVSFPQAVRAHTRCKYEAASVEFTADPKSF